MGDALGEAGLPASWLKIEITERAAMKEEPILAIFEGLNRMGIAIAVDAYPGRSFEGKVEMIRAGIVPSAFQIG